MKPGTFSKKCSTASFRAAGPGESGPVSLHVCHGLQRPAVPAPLHVCSHTVGAPAFGWLRRPPALLLHHLSTRSPPSAACSHWSHDYNSRGASENPSPCAATPPVTSPTLTRSRQGGRPLRRTSIGATCLCPKPSPLTHHCPGPLRKAPPSGWASSPFPRAPAASSAAPRQHRSQCEVNTVE